MKVFTKATWALVAGLAWLAPHSVEAQKTVVDGHLKNGGIFRIQNRGTSSHFITEEVAQKNGITLNGLYGRDKLTAKPDALRQIWVLTKSGEGYTYRNAYTGRYIPAEGGSPMVTTTGASVLYTKYSAANNTNNSSSFVTISWDKEYKGDKCLNENDNTDRILGWKANGGGAGGNNWSDWTLVPATDVTQEEIKEQISKTSDAIEAKDGAYVRIVSTAYGLCMTELPVGNSIDCIDPSNTYDQVWQLVKKGNRWAIKNVLTDRYISQQGGSLSNVYKTTPATTQSFALNEGSDPYTIDYVIADNATVGLHCASSQGYNAVGWYTNAEASQWKFVEAKVDEAELAAAKAQLAEVQVFNTAGVVSKINKTLKYYFDDNACTKLKAAYANLPDDQLRDVLSQPVQGDAGTMALPKVVQDMVIQIKNNTWGHREKEFRIYDYQSYLSENAAWYIGAGMAYSPQTGPTGIHVKRGDLVTVYVDKNPAPGSTLELMNCEGLNVKGKTTKLQAGFNYYVADYDGSLFVNHHITTAGSALANYPDIKVQIQGGYVNGLFDTTRGHTNKDWLDMDATLFKDWVVHMKSKNIQFNLHLDQVRATLKGTRYQSEFGYPSMNTDMKNNAIDKDGSPKGMEGVLRRWDEIIALQHDLMNVKQFEGRFRGMTSASSSSNGNPFASSYGTYYPGVGGIVDYYDLSVGRNTDEGGNRWMVAHETGHNHQVLFNQPGDTEVSNNFFSQVSAWLGGSHVGRGRPWSNAAASFNDRKFYFEYDLWIRCRMYFQLYLYFHEMGHDRQFYQKFFDLFRKQRMERSTDKNAPMSGARSFLRFAEYACQASGLDLSEFFRFYGYFKPLKNYEVGDYSNSYVTTTQAEIDASIARMQKYPKAPAGLIFIDERIRKDKAPATAPSFKETYRWATSGDAQPGNASQVGEVGMYTDFRADIETAPYTCTVNKSTGLVIVDKNGKGAVGFKVYNNKNELVYAANTHRFTLPAAIRNAGFTVYVAYGNGQQESIYGGSGLTAIEEAPAASSAAAPVVYELDGRRGSSAHHGVKIVDGKLRVQ